MGFSINFSNALPQAKEIRFLKSNWKDIDRLMLRNGAIVEGIVLEDLNDRIFLKLTDGIVIFNSNEIDAIVHDIYKDDEDAIEKQINLLSAKSTIQIERLLVTFDRNEKVVDNQIGLVNEVNAENKIKAEHSTETNTGTETNSVKRSQWSTRSTKTKTDIFGRPISKNKKSTGGHFKKKNKDFWKKYKKAKKTKACYNSWGDPCGTEY